MHAELTPEQLARYSQQLKLAGITPANQAKLLRSRVLILGINSTGLIAAHYLAASGAGHIGLMDGGTVSTKDVNTSFLYSATDVGSLKVDAVRKKLLLVNPDVRSIMHSQHFNAHTAESILPQYEVIIDGLNNWQDKLLASDICMRLRKPLIHAGCLGFRLQIYSMLPGKSACLRCVFSQIGLEDLLHLNIDCFGPATAIAGALQASEGLKLMANLGVVPSDELIQFDTLRHEFSTILHLNAKGDCPDCGRLI